MGCCSSSSADDAREPTYDSTTHDAREKANDSTTDDAREKTHDLSGLRGKMSPLQLINLQPAKADTTRTIYLYLEGTTHELKIVFNDTPEDVKAKSQYKTDITTDN